MAGAAPRQRSTRQPLPLVINHDLSREIGKVTQLMRLQDLDGWWLCAVAELENPPAWLKRGVPASFQYYPLQMDSFGNNICRAGLVSEVSVLTDDMEPYEPLAKVLFVKPKEVAQRSTAVRGSASDHAAAGEQVFYGNGQLIRRYFDNVKITIR